MVFAAWPSSQMAVWSAGTWRLRLSVRRSPFQLTGFFILTSCFQWERPRPPCPSLAARGEGRRFRLQSTRSKKSKDDLRQLRSLSATPFSGQHLIPVRIKCPQKDRRKRKIFANRNISSPPPPSAFEILFRAASESCAFGAKIRRWD